MGSVVNEGPAVGFLHLAQTEGKWKDVRKAGLGLPLAFPVSPVWPNYDWQAPKC